jgi:alcohol dehydrogenase YqhD (iron-dependent ADH family)
MYRKARQISDKEPYLEFDEESWDDVREEMVEVPEEAIENPSNFFRDVIANRLRDRGINELRDAMYAGWLWSREEIDIVESKRLL